VVDTYYVCLSHISYVDPQVYTTRGDLVLELALGSRQNSLVRCVHVVKTVERVYLKYC
jgi:hypothetical protein